MSWLDDVTEKVAAAAGLKPAELKLSSEQVREILDLARIASHSSGDRINAPLLCYELGVAVGKGSSLEAVAEAVRSAADA